MDSIIIILVAIIFFLVIALIYSWLTKSKAKKQANKEFLSTSKENNEAAINSTLELKAKIEEIYQKLITGEEVNKNRLENVDKSIRVEISNQQKLIQEKSKKKARN